MGFVGSLIAIAGVATIGYALYRNLKVKDLQGKPFSNTLATGVALLVLGWITIKGYSGVLLGLAGVAILGYTAYRKVKKNDFVGGPLYAAIGAGALLVIVGWAMTPGSPDGTGQGSGATNGPSVPKEIAEFADATLASREETGLMPNPLNPTLGDAYAAVSYQFSPCHIERLAGDKVRFTSKGDKGTLEVQFAIDNVKDQDIGAVAIVEGLTMESERRLEPLNYSGPKAHAALMQIIREALPAIEQAQKAQMLDKLKPEVDSLKDGQVLLAMRDEGGAVGTSPDGRRLADAYSALALIKPFTQPVVTRSGDKVTISRSSAKAKMAFEVVVQDVQGAGKVAVVQSFTSQERTPDGTAWTQPQVLSPVKACEAISNIIESTMGKSKQDTK